MNATCNQPACVIRRIGEVPNTSDPNAPLQDSGNNVHLPAGVSMQEGRNDGVSPSDNSPRSPLLELKVPQFTIRPPVGTTREVSGELSGLEYSLSTTTARELYCCRSKVERGGDFSFMFSHRGAIGQIVRVSESDPRPFATSHTPCSMYIVVGIKGIHLNIPKETIVPVAKTNSDKTGNERYLFKAINKVVRIVLPCYQDDRFQTNSDTTGDDRCLFKAIEIGVRSVRPFYRDVLSLKSVSGFGIYQCFPTEGYHDTVEIGPKTTKTLALLFNDYTSTKRSGISRQWLDWIRTEFNCNSDVPEHGKYALELVLRWSATKFIVWGLSPVLLSLVIGLWYMLKPLKDGEDPVAVVQTAWTISSYIVTAAAVLLGVLAAITQFGNV